MRVATEQDTRGDLLVGRVAVITGGGHGIGRSYARRLAREGAAVVVADIDGDAAHAVAEQLTADGRSGAGIRVDVREEADLGAMAALATDRFGRLDILVNNAAVYASVPMAHRTFDEIDVEEWDRMMDVNLRGCWFAARAVYPAMRAQGYGKIVNIGSGTAFKGNTHRIHYVTSKAGLMGFTRSLAREMGPAGVTVNCVAPGNTLSEDSPDDDRLAMRTAAVSGRAINRIQRPEDIEGAVVFFSSALSDFITGQTLVVDGGSIMH